MKLLQALSSAAALAAVVCASPMDETVATHLQVRADAGVGAATKSGCTAVRGVPQCGEPYMVCACGSALANNRRRYLRNPPGPNNSNGCDPPGAFYGKLPQDFPGAATMATCRKPGST